VCGGIAWVVSGWGSVARVIAKPGVLVAIARAGGLVLLVDFVYFGWAMTHQTP